MRKGWGNRRTPALRGKCEVETCGVDFKQAGIRRHVDHIVPARLIRRLNAGNPDGRENLQCICVTCHGCKLQADHKLCMGDKLSYLEILRTNSFDLVRVERALALYGLWDLEQKPFRFARCQRDVLVGWSSASGSFSLTILIATPVTLPTISACEGWSNRRTSWWE